MKNILLIAIILLASCRKESSYSTTNYICNESNHSIKINYYKDGVIQNNLAINAIVNSSCHIVYQSNGFGKGAASNYLNSTIDMDSSIILFDDNEYAVHYSYNKTGLNPKAIIFGNPRNIFGGSSVGGWTNRTISETKNHIDTELKFIITEKDYLNAKSN